MKRRYSGSLVVVALVFALPYSCAVWERAQDAECIREVQPSYGRKPGVQPKYIGDICFVGRSNLDYLFRLYDAETRTLLAERHYRSTDINLTWGDDFVWYTEDEGVRLPPTWLDRLRAKLP